MKFLILHTLLGLICFNLAGFTPASAQIIGVRTYPLLAEDDMLPIPSERGGTGGAAIATGDRESDPFTNPAQIMCAPHSHLFSLLRWGGWNASQTTTSGGSENTTGSSAGNFRLPVGLEARSEDFGVAAIGNYQHLKSNNGTWDYLRMSCQWTMPSISSRSGI
jgi:hypothetical protein